MTDSVYDGRRVRVLTILDTVTRDSPAIAVDRSRTGQRVVAVLERVHATRGLPQRIAVDNGAACISKALDAWAHRHGVQLACSRPGTPTDNAFMEAFHGRFREECLDHHWCTSRDDARRTIETWRIDGQYGASAWSAR